jgi:translocation and assembly module TamA
VALAGRRRPAAGFLGVVLLGCAWQAAHAELVIEGLNDELAKNVRAYVGLATEPCDAESWVVRRRFRLAESEARTALEPYGYYSPAVHTNLEFGADCWRATLKIDPGPPVKIRKLNIEVSGEAESDSGFSRVDVPAALRTGARLQHPDYEAYKQSLQIKALERGYIDGVFTESRIDVWPEQQAADIVLKFDSGPRYRIGEIRQDQDFLEPSLVSAMLDLHDGDPYDGRELARAYQDLSLTGYFSRIDIQPLFDEAENRRIPIAIHLEPVQRIEYTVGAGYSTDTGPRLRAGFRNGRLNDAGHRLDIQLKLSPVISGLTSDYRIPLSDPRSDWLSYTGTLDVEDTDTSYTESVRFGVRRSKQLGHGLLRTYALDVSYERYEVGDTEGNTLLVLPAIKFDHKYGTRQLYPQRGHSIEAEFRGTDRILGSDTSFLQFLARSRWVLPAGDNGRWLLRLDGGMTSKSDFDELPPSVRFFAGGDQSIRGYDYESLGPEDDTGKVVGGSSLLTASIEYEHRAFGNYYWAAFVDGGNAFNGTNLNPVAGAGIGIKWRSPIGPIRLYVAHGFSLNENPIHLHVSVGVEL